MTGWRASGRNGATHNRRGRRSGGRPGGVRSRDVSAGRTLRAGADQHGRHGRRVYRRQDGGQPTSGQEHGRGLLSAQGRVCDVQALSTLGKRELAEGWAEAIKHGFILDADLVDTFESTPRR